MQVSAGKMFLQNQKYETSKSTESSENYQRSLRAPIVTALEGPTTALYPLYPTQKSNSLKTSTSKQKKKTKSTDRLTPPPSPSTPASCTC